MTNQFINRRTFGQKMRICTEVEFAFWVTTIGIGIGVAVAIAFCRPTKPIATAIATAIAMPTPTDIVFIPLFDAAQCLLTYELISSSEDCQGEDIFRGDWLESAPLLPLPKITSERISVNSSGVLATDGVLGLAEICPTRAPGRPDPDLDRTGGLCFLPGMYILRSSPFLRCAFQRSRFHPSVIHCRHCI
jgi:hypothetical protein